MFEFNMSPAICQHGFALQHDEVMMRDALSIAVSFLFAGSQAINMNVCTKSWFQVPWEGSTAPGLWDPAGQFRGKPALR